MQRQVVLIVTRPSHAGSDPVGRHFGPPVLPCRPLVRALILLLVSFATLATCVHYFMSDMPFFCLHTHVLRQVAVPLPRCLRPRRTPPPALADALSCNIDVDGGFSLSLAVHELLQAARCCRAGVGVQALVVEQALAAPPLAPLCFQPYTQCVQK